MLAVLVFHVFRGASVPLPAVKGVCRIVWFAAPSSFWRVLSRDVGSGVFLLITRAIA